MSGAQLQVSGSRWAERVTIYISPNADGSKATPFGIAKVDRRGGFSFAKGLLGPIPSPLYVVVKEKRVQVVVQVLVASAPALAPAVTPTITPVP